MEELVKQVTERAGISAEQAKKAIETVMGYIKQHGGDIVGKLQGMLAGGGEGGGLGGALGKMFGKKE